MKIKSRIETFYVIKNDKNHYWYCFDSKFNKKIGDSTWFSKKRNAQSLLDDLLMDGECEYGTVVKFKTRRDEETY